MQIYLSQWEKKRAYFDSDGIKEEAYFKSK